MAVLAKKTWTNPLGSENLANYVIKIFIKWVEFTFRCQLQYFWKTERITLLSDIIMPYLLVFCGGNL